MPNFEYNKDYPFAAFITNLGKYNEGELVGEWVKFPTTAEEMQEVFKRIGIGEKDEFGYAYEEWFITDYDCYVDGLYDLLGEYENLDELNYLASKLDDMDQGEYEMFQAAMSMGDHSGSLQEIINLTENLDCYIMLPDVHDHDDLGRYFVEELGAMNVSDHLMNYFDFEAYGRDIALEENGEFTDYGYVYDTGDRFVELYSGRDDIPDEFRVMSFETEAGLSDEKRSEWAQDLAYDLDKFFRQQDPVYAAENPDEVAAKQALHDKLFAGRISAVDERLAALGQGPEDYLPTRVFNYKELTDYEEFLDIDTDALRQAIQNPDPSRVEDMLAFAVKAEREYAAEAAAYVQTPAEIIRQAQALQDQPDALEKDNPMRTAEMTIEDDYNMIDGVINNGRRDEAVEKPSIRDRLADAKREYAEHKPPEGKRPGRDVPELGEL